MQTIVWIERFAQADVVAVSIVAMALIAMAVIGSRQIRNDDARAG